MPLEETLLFVCNRNSGVLPRMKNYSANAAMSDTEACHLSALINSPVGIKKEWKRFIREQKLPSRIIDRNEFREQYGYGITQFPVVLVRTGRGLTVLIGTEELNRCRELEDLMRLLQQRLCPVP